MADYFPVNLHIQNRHPPRHVPRNPLAYSSSSHLLCRAFPRYTRFIRRILARFSFMHRLAFLALFISVLLAFAISLSASVAPKSHSTNYRPKTIHPSFAHHHQHHPSPSPSPSFAGSIINAAVPFISSNSSMFSVTENETIHASYHLEDELIKTQVNLTSLPHTTWYYNKELEKFRPPRHAHHSTASSDMRLIALNDACYCTHRNQFILPESKDEHPSKDERPHSHHHHNRNHHHHRNHRTFPGFVFHNGVARTAPWTSPHHVLESHDQKTIFISGTTILWRGCGLNSAHEHLHRALLPIRTAIDIIRQTSLPAGLDNSNDDIHIAAEMMDPETDEVARLHAYYLGDVSVRNRHSLTRLRPRLVCFHRVVTLGSEYEGHSSYTSKSYDRVKELVEKSENLGKKGRPPALVKSCGHHVANIDTVWIMHRQEPKKGKSNAGNSDDNSGTGYFKGTIENLREVEMSVHHELLKQNLDDIVSARVVQASNVACPPGSVLDECSDIGCNDNTDYSAPTTSTTALKKECSRNRNSLRDVMMFNNMTFLITTLGRANEAFAFMPTGSHIIEVVPYGVLDQSYEQAAREAGLVFHRVQGKLSKREQLDLFERFGDVAVSPQTCWKDSGCKAAQLANEIHIDVHQLTSILQSALPSWRSRCAGARTKKL